MANQLNFYNYFLGEPNSFNFDLKRYNEVSNEMITGMIEKYLSKPFVELRISPKKQ
jgi:zinc protease